MAGLFALGGRVRKSLRLKVEDYNFDGFRGQARRFRLSPFSGRSLCRMRRDFTDALYGQVVAQPKPSLNYLLLPDSA